MSGTFYTRCTNCCQGIVRLDMQTGEVRCGECGNPPPTPPAIDADGQGRPDGPARVADLGAFARSVIIATVAFLLGLGVAAALGIRTAERAPDGTLVLLPDVRGR